MATVRITNGLIDCCDMAMISYMTGRGRTVQTTANRIGAVDIPPEVSGYLMNMDAENDE